MRRLGPWVAVGLLLTTNAIVLLGVVQNRLGEPEAVLTLTERELSHVIAGRENTGLSVRLAWHPPVSRPDHPDGLYDNRHSLSADQLRSVGFDVSVSPTDPRAELHYGKALPLERYAVLELEGPSWQAWLDGERREIERLRREAEKNQETARTLRWREQRFEAERLTRSRLTLIDVGSDPGELRRQHPDRSRTVIAPAVIRLSLTRPWDSRTRKLGEPRLGGYVSEILVSHIHVPRILRAPLDTVIASDERARIRGTSGEPRPPRYQATLRYGRRLEPWLTDIRLIGAGGG